MILRFLFCVLVATSFGAHSRGAWATASNRHEGIEPAVWESIYEQWAENYVIYNCAAKTRDTLHFAGMGFPLFPNLGVGSYLPYIRQENHYTEACDGEMEKFREILSKLEKGETLAEKGTVAWGDFSFQMMGMTTDLRLQFIISAARGKNGGNRLLIAENFVKFDYGPYLTRSYGEKRRNLKPAFRKLLKKMFVNLDEEGLSWLKQIYPRVHRLYLAVSS